MSLKLFDCLHDQAERTPFRPAFVSATENWTYLEVQQHVTELACWLKQQSVQVVALLAENSPSWALVDLACLYAGITLVSVPGFFSQEQRRHVLEDSGAEAILCSPEGEYVTSCARRLPGTCLMWQRLHPRNGSRVAWPVAKVTYTSGTTGQPKGVCLSADNQLKVAQSIQATLNLDANRHLATLSLATLLENLAGLYLTLLAGGTVLLPLASELGVDGGAGLDVPKWRQILNQLQPQTLILTPELLRGLLGTWSSESPVGRSLRFAAVGGGHVPPALLEQAADVGLPVYQGYGLSECSSVVALNTPAHNRPGSVGRPLPHVQVVVAEDGELLVKGSRFLGYLGHHHEQQEWLHTGDLGRLDEDGFLYVEGRIKNLLITSFGRNLSPEWVEAELQSIPGVRQSVIFGDAQPFNVALLLAEPGLSDRDLDQAIRSLNQRLPDYARIAVWERLPEPFSVANGLLTANGRLKRNLISERYSTLLSRLFPVTSSTHAGE